MFTYVVRNPYLGLWGPLVSGLPSTLTSSPLLFTVVSLASFCLLIMPNSCANKKIFICPTLCLKCSSFVILYSWLFIIIDISTKMLLHQKGLSGPPHLKYIIPLTTHHFLFHHFIPFSSSRTFSRLKKNHLFFFLIVFLPLVVRVWKYGC